MDSMNDNVGMIESYYQIQLKKIMKISHLLGAIWVLPASIVMCVGKLIDFALSCDQMRNIHRMTNQNSMHNYTRQIKTIRTKPKNRNRRPLVGVQTGINY